MSLQICKYTRSLDHVITARLHLFKRLISIEYWTPVSFSCSFVCLCVWDRIELHASLALEKKGISLTVINNSIFFRHFYVILLMRTSQMTECVWEIVTDCIFCPFTAIQTNPDSVFSYLTLPEVIILSGVVKSLYLLIFIEM